MNKFNLLIKISNYLPFVGLAFLAVIILFWLGYIWPKVEQMEGIRKEIASETEVLSQKRDYIANLKKIEADLAMYSEEISKIDSSLPPNPDIPSLFQYVQEISSQSGMIVGNLGSYSISEAKDGTTREINFSIQADGSYADFKNFLSVLERSARLFWIENFSFASGDKKSFSFNIGLKTFSH